MFEPDLGPMPDDDDDDELDDVGLLTREAPAAKATKAKSALREKPAPKSSAWELTGNAELDALGEPAERALVMALSSLPAAVEQAASSLRTSLLCGALLSLAKTYNRFQSECDVIHAEPRQRSARLGLVAATRASLAWGLSLLGIPAPERM